MDYVLLLMALVITVLVVLLALGPPPTASTQECPADELLPPCQTRAFFKYSGIHSYTLGRPADDDHNTTLCWMYLEEIKKESEETDRQRYLDTIEETIKGLEARVEALEKWKQCQQEKDQGGSIMPGTGEAFVGQRSSNRKKLPGVNWHMFWPRPRPIPERRCCFGFETDRKCDESNRCKY